MKKSISIGVTGAAVAVITLSSGATVWAAEPSKTSSPVAQQVASKEQETATTKELQRILMVPILERQKASSKDVYNGLTPWVGDDIFSQGFADAGAYLKRAGEDLPWDDFKKSLAEIKRSLNSTEQPKTGEHS